MRQLAAVVEAGVEAVTADTAHGVMMVTEVDMAAAATAHPHMEATAEVGVGTITCHHRTCHHRTFGLITNTTNSTETGWEEE